MARTRSKTSATLQDDLVQGLNRAVDLDVMTTATRTQEMTNLLVRIGALAMCEEMARTHDGPAREWAERTLAMMKLHLDRVPPWCWPPCREIIVDAVLEAPDDEVPVIDVEAEPVRAEPTVRPAARRRSRRPSSGLAELYGFVPKD